MPTAAPLLFAHASLKGQKHFFSATVTQMNNFTENQVNILWLPLRCWNNKMLFFSPSSVKKTHLKILQM